MKIRCDNGETIIVNVGEEFMPEHVKDFEKALKECHIEEEAWLPYPVRFNDPVPNGGIGVFRHKKSGKIIITENTMSDEWVIGIGSENNVESLYNRVAKKLLKGKTGREREDTKEVLEQLKNVLGIE